MYSYIYPSTPFVYRVAVLVTTSAAWLTTDRHPIVLI